MIQKISQAEKQKTQHSMLGIFLKNEKKKLQKCRDELKENVDFKLLLCLFSLVKVLKKQPLQYLELDQINGSSSTDFYIIAKID